MKTTPSSTSDDYPAGTAVEVDGHGSGVVVAKKPGGWYSVQLSGAESAEVSEATGPLILSRSSMSGYQRRLYGVACLQTINTRRTSLRLSVGDASALASDMDQERGSSGVSSPPPVAAKTPGSGSAKRGRDRRSRGSAEKELPTDSVAALSMEDASTGAATEEQQHESEEESEEEVRPTVCDTSAEKSALHDAVLKSPSLSILRLRVGV